MHPHFADGALPLQVGVGLTRMAVTPRQLRLFCSGTLPPSVAAKAMETGFLPALDKDQAYMFTPSELPLYQHAQDHRLLTRDILGYPSLFGDILGLSTRLFLSRRGARIASYDRMNIAFLL